MKALRRETAKGMSIVNREAELSTLHEEQRPNLIIQCPSCQARFALAVSALDGVEQPRFHCSRCDHIFSREEYPAPELVAEPSTLAAPPSIEEFEFDEHCSASETEDVWTTGWSREPSHALEIPESLDRRVTMEAPHESVRFDDASQMSFDFGTPDTTAAGFNFRFGAISAPTETAVPAYSERLPIVDDLPPELLPRRSSPAWRGLLLVAAPLFLFLTVLLGVSYYLRSNPVLSSTLSSRYLPASPQVAPTGLLIRDLKFRNVALENGERVHVIAGLLENRTDRSFKEVILEGLAFDKNGKQLVSQRADAGSTLAKSRIKSLTREMIQELQGRKSARRFLLEPGAKHEFAVALISDKMSAARYYSARIYSVR